MRRPYDKLTRKRGLPNPTTTVDLPCTIHCRHHELLWLVIIALLHQLCPTNAQFDNFEPAAVECPSDSSVVGYTSIEALNGDIDQEIARIQDGGMSQDVYFLVLCPGTFDTSSGPLLPRLDQASYSCAGTGEVSEGCIFSGGEVNIQVEDPGIEGYSINAINFLGITFTGFTGYSIELLGSAPTEAIFMNCLWQDFSADGIARILNENNPPMDLELEMCSIQSSTGDPEDAILDVAFENNGGAMLLGSVLVEAIQVDNTFIDTLENGASMVFESTFRSNSLARLSQTTSGMTEFSSVTIVQNTEIVRMFEANGEGSSTLVENSTIESNVGEAAYQIIRITDGAEGTLLNSTIRLNNPVEYGVYVFAETEGTTPVGLVEDTVFESNIQEDWALVMSEGVGAFAELSRNQFINNTGGIMNIGAFFGGEIRFTQNCFIRNTHFLVALVLEFSEFEAFDNYVEDEVSQVCSGEDSSQGPGRLSVEQPGSMCFRGGNSCDVDCLPNINDSPVCLAEIVTLSPMPTASEVEPSPAPTNAPTKAPIPTASPSGRLPSPTIPPILGNPGDAPSMPPTPITQMPAGMPMMSAMPVCPSCMQPSPTRPPTRPPSGPSKPTIRPPYGHSQSSVRPPTYRPPHHGCKYYGIGHNSCSDYNKYKKSKSEKYQSSNSSPKKDPKHPTYPSNKSQKSSKKGNKSRSSDDGYYYPSSPQQHYGIGGANYYPSDQQYKKSQFGVGYTYAQPRTINSATSAVTNHHGIGHNSAFPITSRAGEMARSNDDNRREGQYHGIGHGEVDESKDK